MLGAFPIGILSIFWLPLAVAALYGLGIVFQRLVLSPIAKFPGPKLAALTRKYETYYEAYQNYEYLWKIKQLHSKYGKHEPISKIKNTNANANTQSTTEICELAS